jgi:MFS family permease
VRERQASSGDLSSRERRGLARQVQIEAGAFGVLKALNDAFISPLLIARGAGPLALGLFNSGANLFGFGAGWLGPRLAAQAGSVRRTTLACLICGRLVYFGLALFILFSPGAGAASIIPLVLAWGFGEGLVLPLWASFIAGMVGTGERGRWLAMRATAATLSTVPVMAAVVLLFLFASKDEALPLAFLVASVSGLAGLVMVARLFRTVGEGPIPPARSFRALPDEPGARRFLGGVGLFWFGSALVWPVLPAYIIEDLHAPPVYFAISQLMAAITGVVIQRRWGKLGDERGAARVLLLSGIGASIVPALWGIIPYYWIGFAVEIFAYVSWPGHMLGLTLRSVELAKRDSDRSALLGWTNLAQGAGACLSPLLASWLVIQTGTIPILFTSACLRFAGTIVMSRSAAVSPVHVQVAEA